ncbi:putative F-box/LRR-repeat protein 23 [Apium graveolens]|uniref:putative F-box/LRR-repeat protein 23 n=1 Tax=Apium graveolens TaxID=4045 RepID=UPI003D78EF67
MLRHFPLLEELQFPHTSIPVECIEVAGRHCPNLKSFTLNEIYDYQFWRQTNNAHALAIVRNMPRLRHLQLFGNRMTVRGLKAILNHCRCLEYLDLRECYFLYAVLDVDSLLGKRCPQRRQAMENLARKLRQRIKHVRFPLDSTEDYECKAEIRHFKYGYYY